MKIEFEDIPDTAIFKWLDEPNPYTKDTEAWQRTELARKMSGKTIAAFVKAAANHPAFANRDPRNTLATLAGKRLIEIDGYKGRAIRHRG